MAFNLVFNENSKMGPAILEPFVSQVLLKKKQKNATFVWFSDYYVKIPL
jgi:hypothetical protein